MSFYVARELGAMQFGAFSLAYVTYSVCAQRARAAWPPTRCWSGSAARDLATWRRAVAQLHRDRPGRGPADRRVRAGRGRAAWRCAQAAPSWRLA